MDYRSELEFAKRILMQMNVPCLVLSSGELPPDSLDMGLRTALGRTAPLHDRLRDPIVKALEEKTVVCQVDEFSCRYVFVPLREQVFIAGPYTDVNVDPEWLQAFLLRSGIHSDWLPLLEHYYQQVCYLEDDRMLLATMQALAEHIWGPMQFLVERFDRGVPESWGGLDTPPEAGQREDVFDRIRTIERRYEAENRLMELVRRGRAQKVQLMLSLSSRAALERRGEATRDIKNYTVILNTLMRKAVESAGVHPLYIDRVSSEFARRIEQTADWDSFMTLWSDMAGRYCLLVRKHITKDLSPLVQKVVARIDLDLTADLSLRATAQALSVNPSYLSAQFKRELGETLTDHVNRKRMEYAAYLLSTTRLHVSAVAQSCGITDDNYFTRLFRRAYGKTPRQFRQERQSGSD